MNLFLYELKKISKSWFLWGFFIGALQLLFMAFFPIMSKDAAVMDRILENYPEVMLKAFGMSGQTTLASIMGYMGFAFVFVELCIAVQSAIYGFGFLSVEERERTADFLFTKPVSRLQIFVGKYSAHVLALMGTALVAAVSVYVSFEWFGADKPYDQKTYVALMSSIPLFQLCFFHLGMLVTVLSRKIKSVLSYAMGASFGLYMLNAVRAIVGGSLLGWFSPFYYFEIARIVELGSWDMLRASMGLTFILLSLGISIPLYIRRNIPSL